MRDPKALRTFYSDSVAFPKVTRSVSKADRTKQLKDEKTAMAAYLKSHRVCEACGEKPSVSVHHRIFKGLGGSRQDSVHSPETWISVCLPCHEELHGIHRAAS